MTAIIFPVSELKSMIVKIGDHFHAECLILIQKARHTGDSPVDLRQRHYQAHRHHRLAGGVLDVRSFERRYQLVDVDQRFNLFFR
jgi:hypothetical protein